ncbi:MAG TPA: nitroreductase family protein [Pseudonocardia sp.]|jgi:hypothetical protein|uniref:Acg family FMN-binding oxidoreductase n=1 Tax=Pseudonocardia sp. TaxID=60912 RepID=UPI002B4B3203|nr:nitroreductase family protein [Pseudonocardia sp.]HLU54832.1 nitroreductase family protein [Pseudonocardia sp.]
MTAATLADAVTDALRAPSVHNTQPWLWRIGPEDVQLHADPQRHLIATDPDRRDLVISCGAALHHLRVALAARGLHAEVHRLPDADDETLLATVTVRPGGDPADAELFCAIARRRTDRRRLSRRPVPADHLRALVEQAARNGATLVPVTRPQARERLLATIGTAARLQSEEAGYAAELRMWTHRLPGGHDGVPATHVAAPPVGATAPSPLRRFGPTGLAQPTQTPGRGAGDDGAELLVLTTAADGPVDRLRAGEAASAVLLAATKLGLATTPLSQATEIDDTRLRIQRDVLGVPERPQLVIRVGWPAQGAPELPATPRRELRAVLLR